MGSAYQPIDVKAVGMVVLPPDGRTRMPFGLLLSVSVPSGWGRTNTFPIPRQKPLPSTLRAKAVEPQAHDVPPQTLAIIKVNRECQPLTEGPGQFEGGFP